MPLSSPSGGANELFGLNNPATFGLRTTRNAGPDATIAFGGTFWHEPTQQIIIGGDNDYIGTKADAYARMIESAPLPVAAATPCRGMCFNRFDNGVLYWDSLNAYFRAPSDLSVWTALAAMGVTTGGVASFANGNILGLHGAGGQNRYKISLDNGATWDSTFLFGAALTGTSSNSAFVTSPDGSVLLIGGTSEFATVTDPDDINSFEVYSFAGSLGAIQGGAISTDNQRAVVVANLGGVCVVDGGLQAGNELVLPTGANLFQNVTGVSSGFNPTIVHYSDLYQGFFIFCASGNTVGFISDFDMTTIVQGLMLGPDGITFTSAISPMGNAASDADGNVFVGGLANVELISLSRPS